MPWKVGTMSELRLNFVQEVEVLGQSVAAACRKYGISRKTAYKWLGRYRAGTSVLTDQSRRPQHSPRRSEAELEAVVVAVRQRYGWGAPKILAYLRNQGRAALPSERTIGQILKRQGCIQAKPSTPAGPVQFFERSQAHALWQCDFKGPVEVARQRVHPFTVLDDHSRFLLALQVCADVSMASAWQVLWATFGEYGLPESLLCDNAFAAGHGGLRTLSWIEGQLIRLGIKPVHGRPYHPQTQGKVERLHGTLEREVWPSVDRACRQAFAQDLERWRRQVYNPLRPHEALGGLPPLSRFTVSPRPRPSRLPEVSYPVDSVLRRVAKGGDISWQGYRILVGAGICGETVRIEEQQQAVCIYYAWKQVRQVPTAVLSRNRLL